MRKNLLVGASVSVGPFVKTSLEGLERARLVVPGGVEMCIVAALAITIVDIKKRPDES